MSENLPASIQAALDEFQAGETDIGPFFPDPGQHTVLVTGLLFGERDFDEEKVPYVRFQYKYADTNNPDDEGKSFQSEDYRLSTKMPAGVSEDKAQGIMKARAATRRRLMSNIAQLLGWGKKWEDQYTLGETFPMVTELLASEPQQVLLKVTSRESGDRTYHSDYIVRNFSS